MKRIIEIILLLTPTLLSSHAWSFSVSSGIIYQYDQPSFTEVPQSHSYDASTNFVKTTEPRSSFRQLSEDRLTFILFDGFVAIKSVPERGYHKEKYANKPVKPQDATDKWDELLGPGPHSNKHPRTG